MNAKAVAVIIAMVAMVSVLGILSGVGQSVITVVLFLAGVWVGLLILILVSLGMNILFIKQLSDDPTQPSKPYFFTAIEPGRIKAVLRGGKVIRYLMNYAGHGFSREGDNRTHDKYWEVTEGIDTVPLTATKPFGLKEFVFWPFFYREVFAWYISFVGRVTKHVFVGIYPWQTLHMYRFSRKVQKLDKDGKAEVNNEGLPILEEKIETTDHVRARPFVWNIAGQAGETREGLKIHIRGVANAHIYNPQKALFGTDRWDVVLTSTILRTLAANIKTMSINEVLTAEVDVSKDKLAGQVVKEANERLEMYGVEVDDYQIIDFEAQLSPEDSKALTAKWRAEKMKEAEIIEGKGRGEGRAAEITAVANALREGGDEAKRAQELEALIRQASEAGKSGGVVIIGSGQQASSGVDAAILAELKKLNK